MQPPQNQDATYLPQNSVDRSLIWLIVGAVGMCFLLLALMSGEPSKKPDDPSYLSRRGDEALDGNHRDKLTGTVSPDLGVR